MSPFRKTLLVLMLCGAVPTAAPAVFRLADTPTYQVDATTLDLRVDDPRPKEYPEVGHRAAVTYEDATRAWASRRFQLNGNSVNTLRISLNEGRVTEKILPIQKGLKGWFKKEQSTAYDAALGLTVAIVDPNGKVLASADGKAWHTLTMVEGTTPEQKQEAWVDMIATTFDNLDREMGAQLTRNLGSYIH